MHSLYSPYGAYELKASYQRNGLKSSACVVGAITLSCALIAIMSSISPKLVIEVPPQPIEISADLPHPPSITRLPDALPRPVTPQNQVVAIPKPVPDELPLDETTEKTLVQTIPVIFGDDSLGGNKNRNLGIVDSVSEYIPSPEVFVPVEREALAVYECKPEYPRLAREAGLEGVVCLYVLVTSAGDVKEVRIQKSSTIQAFDDAAIAAAYKNKYQPAIQNGRAIDYWLGYRVVFELEN